MLLLMSYRKVKEIRKAIINEMKDVGSNELTSFFVFCIILYSNVRWRRKEVPSRWN